jgi:hypothetical protein
VTKFFDGVFDSDITGLDFFENYFQFFGLDISPSFCS